ncbi:hypothetical protein HK102_005523 [Quaeritorhiza haematococci]|nr:hypothetical protein HK102_005523 [Quaeritorhiza haematococci]
MSDPAANIKLHFPMLVNPYEDYKFWRDEAEDNILQLDKDGDFSFAQTLEEGYLNPDNLAALPSDAERNRRKNRARYVAGFIRGHMTRQLRAGLPVSTHDDPQKIFAHLNSLYGPEAMNPAELKAQWWNFKKAPGQAIHNYFTQFFIFRQKLVGAGIHHTEKTCIKTLADGINETEFLQAKKNALDKEKPTVADFLKELLDYEKLVRKPISNAGEAHYTGRPSGNKRKANSSDSEFRTTRIGLLPSNRPRSRRKITAIAIIARKMGILPISAGGTRGTNEARTQPAMANEDSTPVDYALMTADFSRLIPNQTKSRRGATCHIVTNRRGLMNYHKTPGRFIRIADKKAKLAVTGVGDLFQHCPMTGETILLKNVHYAPTCPCDLLSSNLLEEGGLYEQRTPCGPILADSSSKVVFKLEKEHGLNIFHLEDYEPVAHLSEYTLVDSSNTFQLWHEHLGYIGEHRLMPLIRHRLSDLDPKILITTLKSCEPCHVAKSTKPSGAG